MSVQKESSVFGKAGKRKGGSTSPAIEELLAASRAVLSEAGYEAGGIAGSRELALGQLNEALSTGGVNARIPIVQRALEGSRRETSNALRGIDERLASTGLAGTPFGESTRAGASIEGAARTADVPVQTTLALIEQLLPLLQSADSASAQRINAALSGYGTAATAQAGIRNTDTTALAAQKNNFYNNLAAGMRMAGAGG
jgi:hypothetical protein